jgi:integrase
LLSATACRPADDALIFPAADGEPWREHGYRNWRRRQFQKLAPSRGLSRRPYDLRHSFVSLLTQEGRVSVVEIAEQLGHRRR